MRNRTRIAPVTAVATFAALGALLLSGCSSSQAHWTPSAAGGSAGPGASGGASANAHAAIAIAPATSATDVAPATPVTVTATGGATVTAVSVTHGTTTVAGSLSADGTSWKSTGKLAFNTKYTVTVTSTGAPQPTTTTTFTTSKATKTISSNLQANKLNGLKNGGTYGVGQPIIVNFHSSISKSERPAVEAALKVTATPEVEGRWHWVSSTEVDYRGENYWASGTTIAVSANLYGVKFATGVYGATNSHATIKIGDSHVAVADYKTHLMKVYINDPGMVKPARIVKISMGMGGSTTGAQGQKINYWTRNGPHIVLDKSPVVTMSSASYGVTDKNSPFFYAPETVRDDVHISYSGEYVHLRTWSVSLIGVKNTSHGCVNVGIKDAMYMYNLLRPGDIVDVTGSPVPIGFDTTQADWEVPWSQW